MYNIKFAELEFLSPEFQFSELLFKMTHGDVSSKISRNLNIFTFILRFLSNIFMGKTKKYLA